jgi:hypothetical protein
MFKFFGEKAPIVKTSKEAGVLKTLALLTLFMSSCSEKGIPAAEKQEKFKDYYETLDKAGGFVPFELDNGLSGLFQTVSPDGPENGYSMSLHHKHTEEAKEQESAGTIHPYVVLIDSNRDGLVDRVIQETGTVVDRNKDGQAVDPTIVDSATEITDPEALAKAQQTYATLLPEVAKQAQLGIEHLDSNHDGQLDATEWNSN